MLFLFKYIFCANQTDLMNFALKHFVDIESIPDKTNPNPQYLHPPNNININIEKNRENFENNMTWDSFYGTTFSFNLKEILDSGNQLEFKNTDSNNSILTEIKFFELPKEKNITKPKGVILNREMSPTTTNNKEKDICIEYKFKNCKEMIKQEFFTELCYFFENRPLLLEKNKLNSYTKDNKLLKHMFDYVDKKYLEDVLNRGNLYNTIPFGLEHFEKASKSRKRVYTLIQWKINKLNINTFQEYILFIFNLSFFSEHFLDFFRGLYRFDLCFYNLFIIDRPRRKPYHVKLIELSYNFWVEEIKNKISNLTINNIFERLLVIRKTDPSEIYNFQKKYFLDFKYFYKHLLNFFKNIK